MKIEKYFDEKLQKHRWRFDVTINGCRYREAGFKTRAEAEGIVEDLRMDARLVRLGIKPKRSLITLNDLAKERLADHSAGQRDVLKRILPDFCKIVPLSTLVTEIDTSHLKRFATSLHERELADTTINVYLAAISAMLRAGEDYFPKELQQHKWPKVPWLATDDGRTRVLSANEIAKILAACRDPRQRGETAQCFSHRHDVADAIRLALLIGAREDEIIQLKASDVNFDFKVINVFATKTNRSRKVPLCPLALEIVKPRCQTERLFNDFSSRNLRAWCAKAGERADVIWGRDLENGWVFHDLRRTAGTVMEENGVPYSSVSAILGHKRRDKTAVYTIARQHKLREAVMVLETFCREIDGFLWAKNNSVGVMEKAGAA